MYMNRLINVFTTIGQTHYTIIRKQGFFFTSKEISFGVCEWFQVWRDNTNFDFKTWLRKNKCDTDNIAVYLDDTRQMLKSDSEEDFLQKLDTLTSKWSEPVVEHFETYFKSDILNHSGKWIIEKFDGLYDPFSGITNNLSESYNAIF